MLYERDQLWKRIGESPARRLAQLEKHLALVGLRDDLSIELATLYNQTGKHEKARAIWNRAISSRGKAAKDRLSSSMFALISRSDGER